MLLHDGQGQLVPKYGHSAFASEARRRLPEVDLSDCDGGVHLVVGRLAEAARERIAAGDVAFLGRVFDFLDSVVQRADADEEIANAVAISFLEPHDFVGHTGEAAKKVLPVRLRALIGTAV